MMQLFGWDSWVVFTIFLCVGSFLNVVAFRLTHDESLLGMRSQCPHCKVTLAWYDLIPLLSWIVLQGKCRSCFGAISILYPFFELVSALVFSGLWFKMGGHATCYFFVLFFFFFVFLCAARSDIEAMVIPQVFSIFLLPLCFLSAYLGCLPISWIESVVAAAFGYGILWLVAYGFKKVRGVDGLGEGDMELLALIGGVLGIEAIVNTLLVASLFGLVLAGSYLVVARRSRLTRIPFAPFLVFGAIVHFFSCFDWY